MARFKSSESCWGLPFGLGLPHRLLLSLAARTLQADRAILFCNLIGGSKQGWPPGVPLGLQLTVCSAFSSFLMRFKACLLDLLPEEQAVLTELVCGQGAGKSTGAPRDKPEMALLLHTWAWELSMLTAATGFRSLKTAPLCWGRHCGCKAPGQMLQLFTAGWILLISV